MTITSSATDTTPRAWIGCLACYNEGRLVGDWFDAATADEVTTYDVHGAHSRADSHDELWCFDHENIPVRGELDPLTATAWGRCLAEVDEHLRPALCAWVESGDYVAEGTGDLPSISDFEERYQGHWDTFAEYAEQLADNIGLLAGDSHAGVARSRRDRRRRQASEHVRRRLPVGLCPIGVPQAAHCWLGGGS